MTDNEYLMKALSEGRCSYDGGNYGFRVSNGTRSMTQSEVINTLKLRDKIKNLYN